MNGLVWPGEYESLRNCFVSLLFNLSVNGYVNKLNRGVRFSSQL